MHEQDISGSYRGGLREEILGVHKSWNGEKAVEGAQGEGLLQEPVRDHALPQRVSHRDQKETCHASS